MSIEHVGPYLQQCRKAQRLTQEAVARRLEVTVRTISKWETGRETPGAELLARFVDLVQADPAHVHALLLGHITEVACTGQRVLTSSAIARQQMWAQRLQEIEAQFGQEELAEVQQAIEAILRGWLPRDRDSL